MKAVIVKNDQHEIVGFHVTEEIQMTSINIFNWGIEPNDKCFVKQISISKCIFRLLELVQLEAQLTERKNFQNELFGVLQDTGIKIKGVKFDLRGHALKTQLIQEKIATIINRL